MQENKKQSAKKINILLLIAVGIAIVLAVLFQLNLSKNEKETNLNRALFIKTCKEFEEINLRLVPI